MFDEQIDNEPELGEIIEEAFEEEDSISEDGKEVTKDERALQKDEIRNLKTQLMTIREKLADKTAKIEGIKDTLKQSAGVTDFDRVLEQVQFEERDDLISDEDDEDYYLEEQPEIKQQESDPQLLKLQDKVRLLRHRCVASIGNSIFDQALEYLQSFEDKETPNEKRQQLVTILGEESIGYWAIMDQILFYEGLIAELST